LQQQLPSPTRPPNGFDAAGPARGRHLFNGQVKCASCHVPPLLVEPAGRRTRPPRPASTTSRRRSLD